MKILQINLGSFGSTGKIMRGIAEIIEGTGYVSYCAYRYNSINDNKQKDDHIIGNKYTKNINRLLCHYFSRQSCFAYSDTLKLIKHIKTISPDVIHLHNIHGSYVNLRMLFAFLKKQNVKVVWTLHDCWAFTGHCAHFTAVGCDKWKTGCYNCPQYKCYPSCLTDSSKRMYNLKYKWFTGISDMIIVTPSQWLADLVKQSFLKDYPVKVINNGIDLNVFKPTDSDFKKKYELEDKYMVLGVAAPWSERKGLDVFIELSKRLDDKYKIVLVGLSKTQIENLPENIIGIERTANQEELAQIYSAADVFANPTMEENFPTVNIEAIACGTPVVTFNTGGSYEMLDETCGNMVERGDAVAMQKEIERICNDKPYSVEACVKRANCFDKDDKFMEYVKEYEKSN